MALPQCFSCPMLFTGQNGKWYCTHWEFFEYLWKVSPTIASRAPCRHRWWGLPGTFKLTFSELVEREVDLMFVDSPKCHLDDKRLLYYNCAIRRNNKLPALLPNRRQHGRARPVLGEPGNQWGWYDAYDVNKDYGMLMISGTVNVVNINEDSWCQWCHLG